MVFARFLMFLMVFWWFLMVFAYFPPANLTQHPRPARYERLSRSSFDWLSSLPFFIAYEARVFPLMERQGDFSNGFSMVFYLGIDPIDQIRTGHIQLQYAWNLGDFGFRGHIWHEATRNNDKVDFSRHLASCKMFMLDVLLVCCKKTTCELYKRMSPSCLKYVIFPQICSVLHSQWLFHWGIFQPETLGKAQMIYTTITGK